MNCCLFSHYLLITAFLMAAYFFPGGFPSTDFEDCQANVLSTIFTKSAHSDDVILTIFHRALSGNLDLVNGLQYSVNVSSAKYTLSTTSTYLIVYSGDTSVSGNSDTSLGDVHLPKIDDVIGCSRFVTSANSSHVTWTAPKHNKTSQCLSLIAVLHLSQQTFVYSNQVTLCPPTACRHYFTSDWGEITSPGYPSCYPDNADCTFTVIGYEGASSIDIQFQAIQLEPAYSGQCVDHIQVSAANFTSQPYCGVHRNSDLKEQRYVIKSDVVYIQFSSDSKICDTGFKAFYAIRSSKGCTANLTDTTGIIQSPVYPSYYLPNTMCTYSIRLPSLYRVIFKIVDLDLGNLTEGNSCSNDTISITDLMSNRSTILQCSQNVFSTGQIVFESSSSSVDIVFLTDHFLEGRGFQIDYKGVPSCKNESLSGSTGTIYSPSYPQNYPNNQKCFYEINSEPGLSLEFKFISLDTESDMEESPLRDMLCSKDYVHINSGSDVHRICGNWTGKEHIILLGNLASSVMVKFISDDRHTRPGFSMSWRTVPANTNLEECLPQTVTNQRHHFEIIYTFLNWSDGETDCQSRGGHLATIDDVTTQALLEARIAESKNKCLKKSSFWIGASDLRWESDFYWTSGGKVQYTNWFPGWQQNEASQQQPSDDGLSNEDCVEIRRQFHLPWKGTRDAGGYFWNDRNCDEVNPYICERDINGTSAPEVFCNTSIILEPPSNASYGSTNASTTLQPRAITFTSPNFPQQYSDFLDCIITVNSPPGTGIMLEFNDFWLEGPNENGACIYDSLEINSYLDLIEGRTTGPKRLCNSWTGKEKQLHHVIGQNSLALKLTTDHSRSFQGFSARVWTLDANHFCMGSEWLYISGSCFLVSPLPKTSQDGHVDCETRKSVMWWDDKDQEIIDGLWQYLHDSNSGERSFWGLQELDSPKNDCVVATLVPASSQRQHIAVTVSTELGHSCTEEYRYVCWKAPLLYGVHPTTRNFSYSSPNNFSLTDAFNTSTYANLTQVRIDIEAPENHQILVAFSKVDIEEQADCLYDFVEMNDSTLDRRLCGHWSKDEYVFALSETNDTSIRFKSDYSINAKGFHVSWSWVDLSQCHQEVVVNDSSEISFSSFNFPNPYPKEIDCSVTFRSKNPFLTFVVTFDDIIPLGFIDSVKISMQESVAQIPTALNSSLYSESRKPVLVSKTGYLKLKYGKLLGFSKGEGFQATLRAETGTVSLPAVYIELQHGQSTNIHNFGYPNQSPTGILQDIIVRVPIGYNIEVTVVGHENFSTKECSQSLHFADVSLGVANPQSNSYDAKSIDKWCRLETNKTVRSILNRLRLRVFHGNAKDAGFKFNLLATATKDAAYLSKTRELFGHRFDSCSDSPCLNGGVCETTVGGLSTCKCDPRYGGLFCQDLWCNLPTCIQGWCNMTPWGYYCTCKKNYFGVHCGLEPWMCADQLCSGHGRCLTGNRTHPECDCSGGWTGVMCAERVDEGEDSITLGQRLLKEPIWIGLIVILTVLVIFGITYIIRRNCRKYFKCCDIKKPQADDNILNADGTIALNSFPLRKMNRHSCLSTRTARTPSSATHSVVIKTDTDSDGDVLTPSATPSGQNEKAAAKFFASYKDADKNPIATPLTTDFTRTTDTSLSQETEDASVGAMVGGRLLFDLHIRENKAKEENTMERTTSLLNPTTRHKDKVKRSHSTGPYLVRQETQFDEFSVSGSSNVQQDPSFSSSAQHIFPRVIVEHGNSGTEERRIIKGVCDSTENQNFVQIHSIENEVDDAKFTDRSGARVIEVSLGGDSEGLDTGRNTISSPDALSVHTLPAKLSVRQASKHDSHLSMGHESSSKEFENFLKYRKFIKEWKLRAKQKYEIEKMSARSLKNTYSLDSEQQRKSSRHFRKKNGFYNNPLRRTHTVEEVGPVYPHLEVRGKREKYSRRSNNSSHSLDDPDLVKRHHYHRYNGRSHKRGLYHSSWDIPDHLVNRSSDEDLRQFHPGYDWQYIHDAPKECWSYSSVEQLPRAPPSPLSIRSEIHRSSRHHVMYSQKHHNRKHPRYSSSKSLNRDSSSESDMGTHPKRRSYSDFRRLQNGVRGTLHEANSRSKSKVKTQVSQVGTKEKDHSSMPDVTHVERDVFRTVFSQEVEIDDFSPVEDDNIDLTTLRPNYRIKDSALYNISSWPYLNTTSASGDSQQYLSVNQTSDNAHSHTDSEIDYKGRAALMVNKSKDEMNRADPCFLQNDTHIQKIHNKSSELPSTPSSCTVIVYDSQGNVSDTGRPAIVNTRHKLCRKHSSLDLVEHRSNMETSNSNIRSTASLQDLSFSSKEQKNVVTLLAYQSNGRRGSITKQLPGDSRSQSSFSNTSSTVRNGSFRQNEMNLAREGHLGIKDGDTKLIIDDEDDDNVVRVQGDRIDSTYYLPVTDTDSAMSSAPSPNSTPAGRRGLIENGKPSFPAEVKVKDSAYETKQTSMETEAYLETKGIKATATTRGEDRRVTQRLHQAAVKLLVMQQRVRKARQHLSRDSAIHTISEDDPTLDDIIFTDAKTWTYKPGVLYPAQTQGEEINHELRPLQYDRILEEQDFKLEYEV